MASQLVANCPRCGARNITFYLSGYTKVGSQHGWQSIYEAFCVCSHCFTSTIFVLRESGIDEAEQIKKFGLDKVPSSVNSLVRIDRYISLQDEDAQPAPDYIPSDIKLAFEEGAKCTAVNCFNAAACMFRLCVDLATLSLLPVTDEKGLNTKVRRSLGLRLHWLLDNGVLPESLRELSSCIKEDGNDGAHLGTLSGEDAQDLLDFTVLLLERLYTDPERVRIAKSRRDSRRGSKT